MKQEIAASTAKCSLFDISRLTARENVSNRLPKVLVGSNSFPKYRFADPSTTARTGSLEPEMKAEDQRIVLIELPSFPVPA